MVRLRLLFMRTRALAVAFTTLAAACSGGPDSAATTSTTQQTLAPTTTSTRGPSSTPTTTIALSASRSTTTTVDEEIWPPTDDPLDSVIVSGNGLTVMSGDSAIDYIVGPVEIGVDDLSLGLISRRTPASTPKTSATNHAKRSSGGSRCTPMFLRSFSSPQVSNG